jgi:hypothetical protein
VSFEQNSGHHDDWSAGHQLIKASKREGKSSKTKTKIEIKESG